MSAARFVRAGGTAPAPRPNVGPYGRPSRRRGNRQWSGGRACRQCPRLPSLSLLHLAAFGRMFPCGTCGAAVAAFIPPGRGSQGKARQAAAERSSSHRSQSERHVQRESAPGCQAAQTPPSSHDSELRSRCRCAPCRSGGESRNSHRRCHVVIVLTVSSWRDDASDSSVFSSLYGQRFLQC